MKPSPFEALTAGDTVIVVQTYMGETISIAAARVDAVLARVLRVGGRSYSRRTGRCPRGNGAATERQNWHLAQAIPQ